MTDDMSKEKQAQLLLEPGFALELVRAARIKNIYEVSEIKSVDLVNLVVKSLLAIEREKPIIAEKHLTELLAVLIARQINMNEEIGFELTVRDDLRKVKYMATRFCRDEAEKMTLDQAPKSVRIDVDSEHHSNGNITDEEL